MREIIIRENDAGQRLDHFLAKSLPALPPSLRQKYLRLKRIKRNGGRAAPADRLETGDVLQLYINDEFLIDSTGGNNSVQIRKHWGMDTAKWKWVCFGRPTT